MTTIDDILAEIEKRCEAATPGPFAWPRFGKEYCLTGQYGVRPIVLSSTRKVGLRCRDAERDVLVELTPDHPDADFIAHARTDVPRLVKALRRAMGAISRMTDWTDRGRATDAVADILRGEDP